MSSEGRTTKQVIVVRRDLAVRKGKFIAQGCHASLAFLTRRLDLSKSSPFLLPLSDVEISWMQNSFAKVCLKVNNLDELLQIRDNAVKAGLECHMIVDSGRTEFHGQPTTTCLAIGPDYADRIDPITGHLELF